MRGEAFALAAKSQIAKICEIYDLVHSEKSQTLTLVVRMMTCRFRGSSSVGPNPNHFHITCSHISHFNVIK